MVNSPKLQESTMSENISFEQLGLPSFLLNNLNQLGYEVPTPVQQVAIPILLEGHDLLAQAQTGTGKTAAFALPVLAKIDPKIKAPQALILAPTRELAIQVAEAFMSYAKKVSQFHVLPIYGGQDYRTQLQALKRGAQVIVGTPGRVMDHLRRGTLSTDNISTVVLDEADEMLNMGFVEDIEWILEQIKQTHQTALFSATIPKAINKIAKRYLVDAQKVEIKPSKQSVENIEQAYIRVHAQQKMEALTRLLEFEDVDASIIFVRTKTTSQEVADKLQARGYSVAALNGDLKQSLREKIITRIKKGAVDVIVATDVAARGIDVSRVTHVFNYDIPTDPESYVHRIGRTGRAGRSGKAFLFVTPRETRLLRDIERTIDKQIKQIEAPSVETLNERRNSTLIATVTNIIEKSKSLKPYQTLVNEISAKHNASPEDIAAAFAYLLSQETMANFAALETVSHKDSGRDSKKPAKKRQGYRGGKPNKSQEGFQTRKRKTDQKQRKKKR